MRPTDWTGLKAWAAKMGAVYKLDLLEIIVQWGNLQKIPGKMKHWTPEQIQAAQDAATKRIFPEKS